MIPVKLDGMDSSVLVDTVELGGRFLSDGDICHVCVRGDIGRSYFGSPLESARVVTLEFEPLLEHSENRQPTWLLDVGSVANGTPPCFFPPGNVVYVEDGLLKASALGHSKCGWGKWIGLAVCGRGVCSNELVSVTGGG